MIYFSIIAKRGLNDEPWISEVYLLYPNGNKDILYKTDYESIISKDEISEQINDAINRLNIHPTIDIEEALKNMKITAYDAYGNVKTDTNSLSIDILKTMDENKDKLQELNKIKDNIKLVRYEQQKIFNMDYQDYKNEINYKNKIIEVHNQCINYANQKGVQFWRSQDNSINYRINSFTQPKKYNIKDDNIYALLGAHINIYDTIEKVQLFDNSLLLIASYLSIVKDDIFDVFNALEWVEYNNLMYKNTFKCTYFLKKRFLLSQNQLLQWQSNSTTRNVMPITQQSIIQLVPIQSICNDLLFSTHTTPENQFQELNQRLEIKSSSIIEDFIFHLSKDEYQFFYIMNWLANFFQNLNKSSVALVLIGNNKTTNILINNIIKPIFAYREEYFSVVDENALKKFNDTIIKDKIFYHIDTDNMSAENIKSDQLSDLLFELIKRNNIDILQAIELNKIYVHGETIVTSSSESPYPFLKNSYSRCSVFRIKHIDTILKETNFDLMQLTEFIEKDLDNFSNILAQYQINDRYCVTADTDEKNVLRIMKKGVLITHDLERNIQQFIGAIKNKNKSFFKKIKQEEDENLYKELVENFDNDDAIYQPLLNEYFNIIYEDIIFPDNSYFIEILKERECLFNQSSCR